MYIPVGIFVLHPWTTTTAVAWRLGEGEKRGYILRIAATTVTTLTVVIHRVGISEGCRGLLGDVHRRRSPAHGKHVVLQHLEVGGLY